MVDAQGCMYTSSCQLNSFTTPQVIFHCVQNMLIPGTVSMRLLPLCPLLQFVDYGFDTQSCTFVVRLWSNDMILRGITVSRAT